MAGELGTIRLVLRSPEDKETRSLAGQDVRELLGLPPLSGEHEEQKTNPSDVLKDLMAARPVTPAPVSPPPADEGKTFTVRILAGSQVTDVVLESSPESRGSKPSGQYEFWRINGPQQALPAAPQTNGLPTMPPVVAPPLDEPPPATPPAARDGKPAASDGPEPKAAPTAPTAPPKTGRVEAKGDDTKPKAA